MAAWPAAALFSVFLSVVAVISSENTTSGDLNSTTASERDATNNATDDKPAAEGTGRGAAPLPASGGLLGPVTNVGSLCPCDALQDVCDLNCCCDPDCNEEVALFTSCSVSAVRGGKQLCSHDVAYYSLKTTDDGYAELQSSVQKEANYDIFCIHSYNRVDGLSHPLPALPTESNFESLFKQFTSFIFGPGSSVQELPAEPQASPGYQYGDVVMAAADRGQRQMFFLPSPGITADCVSNSPAAFLKDQRSQCSQRVVVQEDCSSLPALSMDTYTNIQLLSDWGPQGPRPSSLEDALLQKSADRCPDVVSLLLLLLLEVVPVEVDSVVLQSADGTQTEMSSSSGENLRPALLNSTLCANVVLKVVYVIKHNSAGEVVNATVCLVLGLVRGAKVTLQQEFQLTYIQEAGGDIPVRYSGNPGYVVGLPLVSGTRTANILLSINLGDTLSQLHSAGDRDCLQGPHQHSPVLFGLDSVSGCTLRHLHILTLDYISVLLTCTVYVSLDAPVTMTFLCRVEATANCSLVSQFLLDVLRGPNSPQYVASFGNSPLENVLEWVQIKRNFNSMETQGCNIPLSLHLEIEWTKFGTLVNPQAQIVSIKEIIQTNTSNLASLSGGSSILPIRSSVAFTPVSANALPGYRATPTINAKLPFDFFFPFV
ncbi:LOW QUALITY PROTEIN: tectonic-1-like [Xenentodon cancila]